MKKVSEWLDQLGSHDIYNATALAANFKEETGEEPDKWPTSTPAQHRAAIEVRGLGGYVDEKADGPQIAGFTLADYLAFEYAGGFRSSKMGRGFRFRECVEAIRAAGK